jgi:uncharacterized glyoxalase superfamily protein PhnB
MQDAAQTRRPTFLPLIRYRDPEKGIAWLISAFGFEVRRRATGADGSFAYAHLAFGESLIMVTRHPKADCERRSRLPTVARLAAQRCYFVIDDIEAHFARAKDAGADILREIKSYEHGGKHYTCRDPEGHIWSFGTYDPWNVPLPVPASSAPPAGIKSPLAWRSAAVAAGLTLIALGFTAWQLWDTQPAPTEVAQEADATTLELQRVRTALSEAQAARAAAEAARNETLAELTRERAAREEAQRSADAARNEMATELIRERAAREGAQRSAEALKADLAAAQAARAAAEQAARDLDAQKDAEVARAAASPAPVVQVAATAPAPPAEPLFHSTNPALAEAEAALATGDLAAARRLLKELAGKGVADAAFALGSTYDPINVARAGRPDVEADRAQAKRWYRRALELAQAAGGSGGKTRR